MKNTLGKFHIYTGNGKGKSTAGLGLAIRALGHGLKVGIIYFDKGGDFYNERIILDELIKSHPKNLTYQACGTQRMVKGKGFRFENLPEDLTEATKALSLVAKWFKKDFDLIILDELNTTVKTNLLKIEDILEVLKNKPSNLELVLTGRYCPAEILDLADLITEMTEIKHYSHKGVMARPGIDY
jgi:cob(I)alamin adenosyltransferase